MAEFAPNLRDVADDGEIKLAMLMPADGLRLSAVRVTAALEERSIHAVRLLGLAVDNLPNDTDADNSRALVEGAILMAHGLHEDICRLAGYVEAMLTRLAAMEAHQTDSTPSV